MTENSDLIEYFALFTEVGIIEQLSRNLLEAELPDGIIAPHFAVLNHLIRVADGQTPLKLATAFQVPKTSMTHTLAGLQRHRLVEMRPNPNDARSKQVWLTDEGRQLRDRTIADLGPILSRVAQTTTPQEVRTVLPILQKLREHLDDARDQHDNSSPLTSS
ncbi:MarR family winged helix-turn-helix transcriptional regulator [Aliiroseovarius sp. YM-037]|uniref:MarR family winged helix-turn-helix transcriptional regulator n=1 Tax=Aliiroseovarius sp. YM-037 TaxID=3341728 RepID=UPI003A809920